MKKINLIFLLLFLLISFDASAQKKGHIRQLFIEVQFNEIVSNLQLNRDKTDKLRPLYFQYLADLKKGHIGRHKAINDNLPNEEIDKILTARFVIAREKAITREKYYKLFKKILTPKQIFMLYETEKKVMKKVKNESMRRKHIKNEKIK